MEVVLQGQLLCHMLDPPWLSLCPALAVQEFRQAAQDFDFGVPQTSLVADDHILQCALSRLQRVQQQQVEKQAQGAAGSTWQHSGVLLMTDDKIMQLKVCGGVLGSYCKQATMMCGCSVGREVICRIASWHTYSLHQYPRRGLHVDCEARYVL